MLKEGVRYGLFFLQAAPQLSEPGGPQVCIPMSVFKRHLPDVEQWSRAVAPTSSRGGLVLA